jgi:ankyrin repeat protein
MSNSYGWSPTFWRVFVQGETAYDLAKNEGHQKVMDLLKPVPWEK